MPLMVGSVYRTVPFIQHAIPPSLDPLAWASGVSALFASLPSGEGKGEASGTCSAFLAAFVLHGVYTGSYVYLPVLSLLSGNDCLGRRDWTLYCRNVCVPLFIHMLVGLRYVFPLLRMPYSRHNMSRTVLEAHEDI